MSREGHAERNVCRMEHRRTGSYAVCCIIVFRVLILCKLLFLSFFLAWGPPVGQGLLIREFLGHTQRQTTVGRTPLDEWSVRRRDLYLTTLTTDRHICPRRDSNPQSQQTSGHWDRPCTLLGFKTKTQVDGWTCSTYGEKRMTLLFKWLPCMYDIISTACFRLCFYGLVSP